MAGVMLTTRFPVTTVVFKLTVPEKPLRLVMLRVAVADEPALIVMVLGLAVSAKSGTVPVEKVAVSTVSGTGVGVPLTMVTQVFGETLVFVQPDWNPMEMPAAALVTL